MRPTYLKSPDYVLRHQLGTCFELSTLLVSLLVGNGYNAYVVSGFATKQCCQNDQTYTNCPSDLEKEFDELFAEETSTADINGTLIDDEEELGVSAFWTAMKRRKDAEEAHKIRMEKEEEAERIRKLEQVPPDELKGRRIHSWVLINIQSDEFKFIEPTTGVIHDLTEESPYLKIESLWDHTNYWLNMNPSSPPYKLSYNLRDVQNWEHLLVAEPWYLYRETVKLEENDNYLALKHFEMPPSWSRRIVIPAKRYCERYPKGSKVTRYRKIKVERFSKEFHSDRLVFRLTKYEDYQFQQPKAIIKAYLNRDDHLKKCRINCENGKTIEEFGGGRLDMLERMEYFENAKPYWNQMKMEFCSAFLPDDMKSVLFTDSRMEVNFGKRFDHLLRYSIEYNYTDNTNSIKRIKDYIETITEQYIDTDSPNSVDKREFAPDYISTLYHYEDKEILQKRISHLRLTCASCRDKLFSQCDCKREPIHKNKTENTEFHELLQLEEKCLANISSIVNKVHDICELRRSERNVNH